MTAPVPTADEMRRLAFIKSHYMSGVEQSHRPGDLAASAVLMFHDSVELFLQLASEHLNESTSNIHFPQYWDKLEPHLDGQRLAERESMRRLNKLRVNLKHDGTFPSPLSIEGFRGSVTSFFEVNTPLIFDGLEFSGISLVRLVAFDRTRTRLESAESLAHTGQLREAVDEIAIAFTILLEEFEKNITARFGHFPFDFGGPTAPGNPVRDILPGAPLTDDQSVRAMVYDVKASISALGQGMKVLALGLDYRRYTKFKLLMPQVYYGLEDLDGDNDYFTDSILRDSAPSSDVYSFCFDFVIESALRLQEFDPDVK